MVIIVQMQDYLILCKINLFTQENPEVKGENND